MTTVEAPRSAQILGPRLAPAGAARARSGERGYNLIILMVMVTVMNVVLALALPNWVQFVEREKEEEAIFRGLQYAEGIRVFQQRHGRPPARLEELVEVKPRAMRQLYPNPLNDGGAWGLLVAAPPGAAPGQGQGGNGRGDRPGGSGGEIVTLSSPNAGGVGGSQIGFQGNQGGQSTRMLALPPQQGEPGRGLRGVTNAAGPILGVWPGVEGKSRKIFNDGDNYKSWHFTTQLIPLPVILGDRPAPRVNARWIGRPFDKGVKPPGILPQAPGPDGGAGLVPGRRPGQRGQELNPSPGGSRPSPFDRRRRDRQ
jgi:type II secretory pathway pseudopilin PulG